jgi:hypothetical protein
MQEGRERRYFLKNPTAAPHGLEGQKHEKASEKKNLSPSQRPNLAL